MKKALFTLTFAMFAFVQTASAIDYLKKGNEAFMITEWKKAAEFYEIVLNGSKEKNTEGDSLNVEAREKLMKCYEMMNQRNAAAEQGRILTITSILKTKKIPKNLYINEKDFPSFQTALDQEISKNPNLKSDYAEDLVDRAGDFFTQGKRSLADKCYSLAVSYDNRVIPKIISHYISYIDYFSSARSDCQQALEIAEEGLKYSLDNESFNAAVIRVLKLCREDRKFDNYRKTAVKIIGEEAVNKEFPPKTWQVVFEETYIGKGWDENNSREFHVKINHPNAYQQRQIIECTGKFKVWKGDVIRWVEYDKKHSFIVDNPSVNGYPGVEIEKDAKLTFIIEEFK